MIKVLHLTKEYKGNYPLLNEYVKALPIDDYYSVVCYLSGQADGKDKLESIASKVIYLNFDKKKLKHFNPQVIFSLSKIMKKEKINIVHCHRHKATVIGTIAATLAGVPHVISTVHGTGRTRTLGRKITNWFLSKKVSRFIGVSEGVKEDLLKRNWGISEHQVVAIPNGLNYQPFLGPISREIARETISNGLQGKFLFGTIGRLTPKKNHSSLIDAIKIVLEKKSNIHLVIVGKGPLYEQLMQKVKSLNLKESITFTGFRTDIPVVLHSLDAFILPSRPGEGLPLALLEAMGAGLPVIASKIAGIMEVFDGVNIGRLIDPTNVEEIADTMVWLASLGEAERRELGLNAQRHAVSNYSAEIMAKKIRNLYESLK